MTWATFAEPLTVTTTDDDAGDAIAVREGPGGGPEFLVIDGATGKVGTFPAAALTFDYSGAVEDAGDPPADSGAATDELGSTTPQPV